MESYIPMSFLNDFIFCPRSIYFHQLYGSRKSEVYQQRPQVEGKAAHTTIDRQVRKAHGLYQLRPEHFNLVKGQHLLSIEHNRDYTRWLVKTILDHKEQMFTYVQEYYRCFIRQRPIDQYPVFSIND